MDMAGVGYESRCYSPFDRLELRASSVEDLEDFMTLVWIKPSLLPSGVSRNDGKWVQAEAGDSK